MEPDRGVPLGNMRQHPRCHRFLAFKRSRGRDGVLSAAWNPHAITRSGKKKRKWKRHVVGREMKLYYYRRIANSKIRDSKDSKRFACFSKTPSRSFIRVSWKIVRHGHDFLVKRRSSITLFRNGNVDGGARFSATREFRFKARDVWCVVGVRICERDLFSKASSM